MGINDDQGQKMFSRFNEELKGSPIPAAWIMELEELLNTTYEGQLKLFEKRIKVFGELHPKEIAMAFSILSQDKNSTDAITLMVSGDLNEKDNPKKTLDHILNYSSEFFDLIFNDQGQDEFQPNWVKTDLKKDNFFFKITRENVELTLMANKLLEGDN